MQNKYCDYNLMQIKSISVEEPNFYIVFCTSPKRPRSSRMAVLQTSNASHLFKLVLLLCHQSLLAPVFEHLEDGVARYACSLHGDALLQGLFKAEVLSQPLKDAVVLSPLAPVA